MPRKKVTETPELRAKRIDELKRHLKPGWTLTDLNKVKKLSHMYYKHPRLTPQELGIINENVKDYSLLSEQEVRRMVLNISGEGMLWTDLYHKSPGLIKQINERNIPLDEVNIFKAPTFDFQVCIDYAQSRGGQCLSKPKDYKTNRSRLKWKCSNPKHPAWTKAWGDISSKKTWCKKCAAAVVGFSLRNPLSEIYEFAQRKNLTLLTQLTEAPTRRTKLTWQCNTCSDIFDRTYGAFKTQDTDCWVCANAAKGLARRYELEELKSKLHLLGFDLLTEKKSVTTVEQVMVRCHAKGHVGPTTITQKLRGVGCGGCSISTAEQICHAMAEEIFQVEFRKRRFRWDLGKDGKRLEIDFYNDDLKLGFEYQGDQHYRMSTLLHGTEAEFQRLKRRDKAKLKMAKAMGFTLIVIPTLEKRLTTSGLRNFIIHECKKMGIPVPKNIPTRR